MIFSRLGVSTWKYDYEEMGTGLAECRIAARSSTKAGVFFYKDSEKRQETGRTATKRRKIQFAFSGIPSQISLAFLHIITDRLHKPKNAQLPEIGVFFRDNGL